MTVFSHARPLEVVPSLQRLIDAARASDVTLRFDPDETNKHGLTADDGVIVVDAEVIDDVVLCVAFGGDGTILRGLRRYAGTGVPVLGVNYGEVGFLATVEPEELNGFGFRRAFAGEFEELPLPAIVF
ncbi:MAG TPA: NAD(+)/NADH kinase, partial [Solirubrobacteraceae bacterium]|nr:NAD(+)/NADH kinase [Solirubrobacteraceae bacterium]